jgi:hypothetical protein
VIPHHSCTVAACTLNATAKRASDLYESSCDALLDVHPTEHDRQSKAFNKIQTWIHTYIDPLVSQSPILGKASLVHCLESLLWRQPGGYPTGSRAPPYFFQWKLTVALKCFWYLEGSGCKRIVSWVRGEYNGVKGVAEAGDIHRGGGRPVL